jgi:putative ABC transport system permease protein
MDKFWHDLRYARRTLFRTPAFTVIAVATLALGIGATTVMFAVVDAVLLRPLPYKDADRLVFLTESYQRHPGMSLSVPNLLDWRAQNRVFSSIGAIQPSPMTLTGNGTPQQLEGRYVTYDFLRTLGIAPALGRDFAADDDRAGAPRTLILSFGAWQRLFAADEHVVGRAVTVDQQPYTVIGVLPRGFVYGNSAIDVLAPIGLQFTETWTKQRASHAGIYAVARLKDGVTLEQAKADMDGIAERLQQQYPATNRDDWASVRMLRAYAVRNVRDALLMLMGAVGFLLLIACANVANLLLARAAGRRKEVAIRAALGASRWRLITQLLTESVLLGCCGGATGVLIALWGTRALVGATVDALPRFAQIALDIRVLAFTFAVSILTGVIFGLAPALQSSFTRSSETLKEGERGSSDAGSHRLRSALVVAELSLSLALLLGTGLLVRSFVRVLQVNAGFDTHNVLSATMRLSEVNYKDPAKAEAYYRDVMQRVQAIPGVLSASAITPLPLSGNEWDTSYWIEGGPEPEPGKFPSTEIGFFDPEYLKTMEIPLLAGRTFTAADNLTSLPVIVVNDEFVKKHWPNDNPIGKRMKLSVGPGGKTAEGTESPWRTVVGVIGTVKQYGLDSPVVPQVYFPYAQPDGNAAMSFRYLVVRTAGDPLALSETLRKTVAGADPDQAISNVESMDQYLGETLASRKLVMGLLAAFAGLAMLLAGIGIYGVISYTVAQRTREIGIRMALGARREQVLGLILRGAGIVISASIVIGTVLALALGRSLKAFLYGVPATDAGVFSVVILFLALIALLASYLPARRATKVDPMIALRYE